MRVSEKKEEKNMSHDFKKVENILLKVRKILIWEYPFYSSCCIMFVNIVFWLIIINLDLRFYGILFTVLLMLTIEELWSEHISCYIKKYKLKPLDRNLSSTISGDSNSRALIESEIDSHIKENHTLMRDAFSNLKVFRQSQHGLFCVFTCLCLLILGVIGRFLSGAFSVYVLVMITMTLPGLCIHILPPSIMSSVSNFIHSSHNGFNGEDDDDEPYLPETSKETMELLTLAGDLQLPNKEDDEEPNDLLLERISERTSDTTESVCSKLSFYPESSLMPSPENSMDFLELDLQSGGHSDHEKSESNDSEDINFQSKHFDGDSSDEEEFAKGLKLAQKGNKIKEGDNKQVSNTVPSLLTVGTNFLTAVVKQSNSARTERESSSDTDSFEIISEEDM